MAATVLITGGTGLTGRALSAHLLEKGYEVIVLTRDPRKRSSHAGLSYAVWDVDAQRIDRDAFARADYLIHLAGEGIADKRWSEKRKKELVQSRTRTSELLVKSLKEMPHKIRAVISAAAIGWYGADPSIPNPRPFVETDAADSHGFLGQTCLAWEQSIEPVSEQGIRLVKLRTGPVLSKDGGYIGALKTPAKLGVAPVMGKGDQVLSWIHIHDLVRIYSWCLEQENLAGVFNAVAPQPVSNRELMKHWAAKKKIIRVPVPALFLKIGLGELSVEVLKSATVSSKKIEAAGFSFNYPSIEKAIAEL